jgi:hypothetical protein
VTGVIEQLLAADEPALIIVANAVAVLPPWTERLDGSTAETKEVAVLPTVICPI